MYFYHLLLVLFLVVTLKPSDLSAQSYNYIASPEGDNKLLEKRGFISDSKSMVNSFLEDSCEGLEELNVTANSPNGDKPGDDIESLIKHAGYQSKRYKVETQDGYILSMFRVFKDDEPEKNDKATGTPVILVHGLMGSVKDWVINDKENVIPYRLVEEGRDVWLAGNRGTPESKEHKELNSTNKKYWSFSYVEMGNFDDPAFVDKVREVTGYDQVYWIGFGLGNKQFFTWISAAPTPKNCTKIKAMWALSPQCYLYNTRSPVARALSVASKAAGVAIKLMGSNEFSGKSVLTDTAKNYMCTSAGSCPICDNLMRALGGFNKKQENKKWHSILMIAIPSSTSTQNIVHYGQDVYADRLGLFDYGPVKNAMLYGMYNSITPPQINPGVMKTEAECKGKINIMYAVNDWLSDIKDAEKLRDVLGPAVKNFYKIDDPKWSHFDFIWGKNADKFVIEPLLKQMKEYETNGGSPVKKPPKKKYAVVEEDVE